MKVIIPLAISGIFWSAVTSLAPPLYLMDNGSVCCLVIQYHLQTQCDVPHDRKTLKKEAWCMERRRSVLLEATLFVPCIMQRSVLLTICYMMEWNFWKHNVHLRPLMLVLFIFIICSKMSASWCLMDFTRRSCNITQSMSIML